MGGSSAPGRIVIADDHEIVRAGLRLIIEEWEDYVVVGEAEDGAKAVEQVELQQPDLVFMDIAMPVMNGIDATQMIKRDMQGVKIVMLTADRGVDSVMAALASGAQGYCLKTISAERLHAGTDCVRLGDLWLDQEVAQTISEMIATDRGALRNIRRRPARKHVEMADEERILTSRELGILELIVRGYSNSEIAGEIFISRDTVKTHVANILKKLSASDRTQAAVKALREGLV